jgi:hypothetical protein
VELLVMPVTKSPVGIFLAELEAGWLPINPARPLGLKVRTVGDCALGNLFELLLDAAYCMVGK